MSNVTPPPAGPPAGPPSGPPAGGPEYLDQGGGAPLEPTRSRKPLIIGAAAVIGLGLAGGATWAAVSFMATGDQPAGALPASTLGYVSIDLDPSGGQKIEAIQTLNKFPAFEDELGLDTGDDIREKLFELAQDEGACPDIDYQDDIAPWLGDRAAFAGVDVGEERPTVAAVLQVSDADGAEEGIAKLKTCGNEAASGSEDADEGGYVIRGDWLVVSETEALAEKIADQAEEASLADDEDFQTWTERAGDPGIVSMYAAPEAGTAILEEMESSGLDDELGGELAAPEQQEQAKAIFEDFEGAAGAVRFADEGLEVEFAASLGDDYPTGVAGGQVGESVAALPVDTLFAYGLGFEDGWMGELVDLMESSSGDGTSMQDMLDQLSEESGLDLPGDIETLLGDSSVIAVGADFDVDTLTNSSDGSDVPVAVKVEGDPDAVEDVLAKITGQLPPEVSAFVDTDSDGDTIVIGPNADYRQEVLAGGELGDSEKFDKVIREADRAGGVVYIDFDAADGWLAELAGDDPQLAENFAPLSAFGMSSWLDGDVVHGAVRVTTD